MSYVLSIVRPPENGAAYGKATVHEGLLNPVEISQTVRAYIRILETDTDWETVRRFADNVGNEETGTVRACAPSGLVFRVDPEDRAPNACPCCGRLVLWSDHALAGSDDAYCDGCYVWSEASKISCDPQHTAHANPWTEQTQGARWFMHVVIDRGDETDYDVRYTADESHEMWDPEDNALIAWPGLSRDQIIEVTIKEIKK